MPASFRALCNDFYINQRLALKMDLAMRRDTVLAMFDRVRREHPWMERFRRYPSELALESAPRGTSGSQQQWVALRKSSVRSGSVNPETADDAMRLHRLVLEICPYFLDISALDIDHVELLYGFDLLATGNHDAIVYRALMQHSPLASMVESPEALVLECSPVFGVALDESCSLQAHVEVKTRTSTRQIRTGEYLDEPMSVYLTVRKYGPISDIKDLAAVQAMLVEKGEELVTGKIVPNVLVPIHEAIVSG